MNKRAKRGRWELDLTILALLPMKVTWLTQKANVHWHYLQGAFKRLEENSLIDENHELTEKGKDVRSLFKDLRRLYLTNPTYPKNRYGKYR